MSALGQKQTWQRILLMSALPQKPTLELSRAMSALCQKRTLELTHKSGRCITAPARFVTVWVQSW